MDVLNLAGTSDTPAILLDKTKKVFEITGRSLPEDSAAFYKPVIEWLGKYSEDPLPETEFVVKLEYFNTSSSKLILDVLTALEEVKGAKIVWYFQEDDEDMEEAGQEFSELVEIPFEYKSY